MVNGGDPEGPHIGAVPEGKISSNESLKHLMVGSGLDNCLAVYKNILYALIQGISVIFLLKPYTLYFIFSFKKLCISGASGGILPISFVLSIEREVHFT